MRMLMQPLEARQLMHADFSAAINFQPLAAPRAPGMLIDYGSTFDVRRGGLSYGWDTDHAAQAVDRNATSVQRNDTFIDISNGKWEIAVPDGDYNVYVVSGDSAQTNQRMAIDVEGAIVVAGITRKTKPYLEGGVTVHVSDGRLTVAGAGAATDKINYIAIQSTHDETRAISISATVPHVGEGSDSPGKVLIQRTGDLDSSLVVPLTIQGAATNGTDYGLIGNSVTFAPGVDEIELPIRAVDDDLSEGDETVQIVLGNIAGYQIAQASASVTISDSLKPMGVLGWKTSTPLPFGKAEAFGGAIGGKLYVFGGFFDNTFKPSKTAHVFDPASKLWKTVASLPEGLSHAATAFDTRYMYYAGGYPATATGQTFSTTKVYRYDSVTNTYAALPNLPQPRGAASAALVGRHLYVMGGADQYRKDRAEVWRLDLDNLAAGWVARKSLPEARNHPASIGLNGYVYMIGGQKLQDSNAIYQSAVWRYSPSSNTWTTLASLPSARSHITSTTFILNGKILTIGGEGVAQAKLKNVNQYDPATNTWKTLTSLPAPRLSGVGDVIAGKLYFTSGYYSTFEKTTYIGTFA